jgi:hypothetical protein
MEYSAPYVLYSALSAEKDIEIQAHVEGYMELLDAICQDRFNFKRTIDCDILTASNINNFMRNQ